MAFTLDQALQKAVKAHKTGKLEEADRYYAAILKANPKHPMQVPRTSIFKSV